MEYKEFSILDLGYDKNGVKASSLLNLPAVNNEITGQDVTSGTITVGNNSEEVLKTGKDGLSVGDAVFADAPFSVEYDGTLKATSATISGTITGSALHIPDENVTANSFHVEIDGDTFWGCTQADFTADNDNATAYILKSGQAKFQNISLDTDVVLKDLQAGSALAIQYLTAGSITSKAITLAVAAGTGDSKIQAGKTDFTNTESGFILGIDDSDSDLAKFFIGNTTDYFNWDGSNVNLVCSGENAITIKYGSDILLEHGGDIKFTSVDNPTALTAALVETSGNVDAGVHRYRVTFINAYGETAFSSYTSITTDVTHKQVSLTNIPVSTSSSVTQRKIYRTKVGDTAYYYLLDTLYNNTATTYTDNIADVNLTGTAINFKINHTAGKIKVNGNIAFSSDSSNMAVGERSLGQNISGSCNTALGQDALADLDSTDDNTAIGWDSLMACESTGNTAVGSQSLLSNETGDYNVAIGLVSLANTSSGDNNVAVGYYSLGENETGSGNIAIGSHAGEHETSSDAFYINNRDRTNTAGDKSLSLLYGVMADAAANQKLTINGLLNQSVSKTPASAGAAGTAGDICWDASYIYVCTATNTWKRAGIATW